MDVLWVVYIWSTLVVDLCLFILLETNIFFSFELIFHLFIFLLSCALTFLCPSNGGILVDIYIFTTSETSLCQHYGLSCRLTMNYRANSQ